jgi:two-component system response regulator NreC
LAGGLVRNHLERHPEPPDDPLTPREREILTLIAQGFTNRDIGERLTLSLNTVKTHRLHIFQKLHFQDRAGLIDYALRNGLLHP